MPPLKSGGGARARWILSPGEINAGSSGVESSTIEISGSTLETVMLEGKFTPLVRLAFRFREETEVILSPLPEPWGLPARPAMRATPLMLDFYHKIKFCEEFVRCIL